MSDEFRLEIQTAMQAEPMPHVERRTPPPSPPADFVAGGMAWLRVGKKRFWVAIKEVSACKRYVLVLVNTRNRWVAASSLERSKQ